MGFNCTIDLTNNFNIIQYLLPINDKHGYAQAEEADQKDVELVMQQTGCSHEEACASMHKCDNDLVNAIMSIMEKQEKNKKDYGNYEKKDIDLVAQQANCTHEQAYDAIVLSDGDIVNAIMLLSN